MSTDDTVLETQLTELGNRISAQRRGMGLSIEEVAKATRVSAPTIARIEAGNGGVGAKNLLTVMSHVGLPTISEDSPVMRQAELPAHALHMESPEVQEAIEDAARAACARLDELFPGVRKEVDGITSNFQGLLAQHISAMLRGQPHYRQSHWTVLPKLVYSDVDMGSDYSLPDGANGYLVRLVDTQKVLEDRKFRLAHRVSDMYTSWEYAAAAVRDYVETEGHLPGPVRIVPGWWSEGETGVRFTSPKPSQA
ncbi:helix-turn-helix transcriptional regulator [Paraburkholderia sp. A2RO-4L]|uniref:helix-turn-helix domain-containing protein n=1 Tax=Paraburkholderia sp. A2RO-4L TaxID=3028374 RepID=UPI0032F3275A|nr:helix-turn-helix transcriptional regulator [Burkholderia vietnamiensis]